MLKLFFCIVLTFIIFARGTSPAAAQDLQQIAPATPGVTEFFREGGDISGAVVLGVQVQAAAPATPHLIGYLPEAWKGQTACIHIVASDGRYEAYGNYPVPASWAGAPAVLEFVTQYGDLWQAIPTDGIGAMVSLGPCGQGRAKELSVVWWDTPEPQSVDVIINSFNSDTVFIYIGASQEPVLCQRLGLTTMIAFDSKCSIPPGIHTGSTKIDIYRLSDGKPSQPTSVVVWLPED